MSEEPSLNYFRLWMADYAKDTARLSLPEHGAYLLLLLEYYSSGPLPDDIEELHRICRALSADEQQAVAKVAQRFFPVNGDGRRHNKRADIELETAKAAIEKMRAAGARGAVERWGKDRAPDRVGHGVGDRVVGRSSYPLNHLSPQPLNPSPSQPLSPSPKAKRGAGAAERHPSAVAQVWDAYAAAYRERYAVEPTPNAAVNGQLAQFVRRVPAEDAPAIAAFYVRSNAAFYVKRKHSTRDLLANAEGLRTEWLRGEQMTDTRARQLDRTAATAAAFAPLIAEAEQRERAADASE